MQDIYISDLDGTLLNEKSELSPHSIATVQEFIKNGGLFTFCTGRPLQSAFPFIEQLGLKLPVGVSHGAAVYCPHKGFTHKQLLNAEIIRTIGNIAEGDKVDLFLFGAAQDGQAATFFSQVSCTLSEVFFKRSQAGNRPVHQIQAIADQANALEILQATFLGTEQQLKAVLTQCQQQISATYFMGPSLVCNNMCFLDISSTTATKADAVRVISQQAKADRIIGFGDNLNDIGLFNASTIKVAVANAKPELLALADHVIGQNTDDAVAQYLITGAK